MACVNWDEAQAYVAWLNTQSSGGYRLLTEVEWEYVAHGGAKQNFAYPWGNDPARGLRVRQRLRPHGAADVQANGYVRLQDLRPDGLLRWLAQHLTRRLAETERLRRARHHRQRC